jgi:hypothetical protein
MCRKILIGLLICASILWCLALVALQVLYSSHLPSVPNSNTGEIYRMVVNHGRVRFGTDREVRMLRVMEHGFPIAGLVFLSALLLGLRLGVLYVRGQDPTSKQHDEPP